MVSVYRFAPFRNEDGERVKECSQCRETLPEGSFGTPPSKRKLAPDGGRALRPACKACMAAKARADRASITGSERVAYRQTMNERRARYVSDPAAKQLVVAAQRRAHYKRFYGLTPEDADSLARQCNNQCNICGLKLASPTADVPRTQKLCVDHCHSEGHVRGLLCEACNKGLGMMRDDPARLRSAAAYLERTKRKRAA